MIRLSLPAASVLIASTALLTACTAPAAAIGVSLYGRNAAPVQASFAVQPAPSPPLIVAFAQDPGVACWTVPAGSQIVLLDHNPSLGPAQAVRTVGMIEQEPADQGLWVDVAADGTVTSGAGVPAWWPPGGGGCPEG